VGRQRRRAMERNVKKAKAEIVRLQRVRQLVHAHARLDRETTWETLREVAIEFEIEVAKMRGEHRVLVSLNQESLLEQLLDRFAEIVRVEDDGRTGDPTRNLSRPYQPNDPVMP